MRRRGDAETMGDAETGGIELKIKKDTIRLLVVQQYEKGGLSREDVCYMGVC
jgi:hypothetical protein